MKMRRELRVVGRAPATGAWRMQISCPRLSSLDPRPALAFTLIEIMVVVAVMGLVMAMGIPAISSGLKQEGMRKAVNSVVEACGQARAQAIITGGPVALHFHPKDRRMDVGAASQASGSPVDAGNPNTAGGPGIKAFTAQWPENVTLEMLDVNLREFKEEEEAEVTFYPNGTCDELTVIFHGMKDNAWRKISTEITTGLTSVDNVR